MKELWDGIYGFLSLSEKTRKSFADVITKAALSSQLFKDPECWSGRDLNQRPPARRTGALPTELTRRRFFKWRYDLSSGNSNLRNCELTGKNFRDFNGIRTRITRIEVVCDSVLGNSRHLRPCFVLTINLHIYSSLPQVSYGSMVEPFWTRNQKVLGSTPVWNTPSRLFHWLKKTSFSVMFSFVKRVHCNTGVAL